MSAPIRKRNYVIIWVALMILLGLTWLAAQVNLGAFNTPVALAIAFLKMVLIILIFMHVRYEPRITWIFVIAGFVWLAIMIDLTLSDYLTRGSVRGPKPAISQPSERSPG